MTAPLSYAVVGAGAIGAHVGASLARGGAEVTRLARGAHLRAMQERGVEVRSPRGDFRVHPQATDDLAAIGAADVVFLGLKAYSLPELAPRIGSLLKPGACVVGGQNGIPWWYFQGTTGPLAGTVLESVDPGGVVTAAIPHEAVIGCVVYTAAEIVEPGVIRHVEGTRYALGEPDGTISERCRAISADFQAGGLKAPVEAELRDQIWLKLIGNAAFNPVAALTGATLGRMGESAEVKALLRGILEEGAAVAAALGVELAVSLDRRLEAGLAVGDHKPSTLIDLEAGKPLELGCMTGAVIEIARLLGVQVPRTEAVHACATLLGQLRAARLVVSA